jgi:hypothetical protein
MTPKAVVSFTKEQAAGNASQCMFDKGARWKEPACAFLFIGAITKEPSKTSKKLYIA